MDRELNKNKDLRTDMWSERFLNLLMLNNKKIYTFIFTMVHNHFDADDIMQDTVTFMYRNFDKYQEGSNFAAWGIKIAHYRILNYRRKQKGHVHFDAELYDMIKNETEHVQDDVNVKLEALQRCRGKLPKADNRILEMRYDSNVSVKDIAEYFGQSTHRIYRSVARIHDMLLRCVRKALAREY